MKLNEQQSALDDEAFESAGVQAQLAKLADTFRCGLGGKENMQGRLFASYVVEAGLESYEVAFAANLSSSCHTS